MTERIVEQTVKMDGYCSYIDTVEREEVVRCRDCKHFATNIHGSYCKKSITTLSEPDGFCAWGVRKDD